MAIIAPAEDPLKQIDKFIRVVSRAGKAIAVDTSKHGRKIEKEIEQAFRQANKLRSLIAKNPEQMFANLAESWRDREAGLVTELRQVGLTQGENGTKATNNRKNKNQFMLWSACSA